MTGIKIGRQDYEERRARRIDRLNNAANRTAAKSTAALESVRRIADMIPFGQPILVGHHSERRARRDAERIHDGMRKGLDLSRKSDHYAARAAAAAENYSISSDDPKCLEKLTAKAEAMQARLDDLRAGKKAYRKASTAEERAEIRRALGVPKACYADNRESWPDYPTTNLAGNLRRVKLRIADIQKTAERSENLESVGPVTIGDVEIRTENNRTMLVFPGKPAEEIRAMLKSYGFRWAPSVGAWQRMASAAAHVAAEAIARKSVGQNH